MAKSREETHAEWAKHMQAAQKANPETDGKLDTEWWKPAADLGFDDQLDEQAYAKMNERLTKLFTEDMAPADKEKTLQEAREYLKDHPKLLQSFDDIITKATPGVWSTVNSLRKNPGIGGK
ncbi:hypothetical protein PWT90_09655 [Aphanocladium album]|nr:hypothetical protein PWT90_09655 [Aphanocladium album]